MLWEFPIVKPPNKKLSIEELLKIKKKFRENTTKIEEKNLIKSNKNRATIEILGEKW